MKPYTILLVGSNNLLWTGVRAALQSMPGFRVVDDLSDPPLVVERACLLNPDALVMEWETDGAAGATLLCEIREHCPGTRVVLVAARFDAGRLQALARLGIEGYLTWKDLDHTTLRHCLEAVLRGKLIVTSRAVASVLGETTQAHLAPDSQTLDLTEREHAVLRGLADGLTQKQIAAAEQVSPRTVKRAVAALAAKLDASSPFVLGAKARTLGLAAPSG